MGPVAARAVKEDLELEDPKSGKADQGFLDRVRGEMLAYIEETGQSQAEIARAIGASGTMVSQFLNDRYPGFGINVAKRMSAFLALQARRLAAPPDAVWVETAQARRVLTVLAQCHELKDLGMVFGAAGLGKTRAAEQYKASNPDVILIRVTESIRQRRPFLRHMARLEGVKAPSSGAMDDLFEGVLARLRGSGRLLIIDEAQKLDFRTLELVRDLRDLARIGVVLMGNEMIWQMLHTGRTAGQYEQQASRVGIRVCLQRGPAKKDVETLARQYIDGADSEAIAYLHAKSQGVGGYRAVINHCRMAYRIAAADGGRTVTREDLEGASELLG